MENQLLLGIDLGGTNIKTVLIDSKGEVLEELSRPTGDEDGIDNSVEWKAQIKEMVDHFRKKTGDKIEVIGIAAPGTANSENTAIASLPNKLIGIEHFIWKTYLNFNTYIINDAHAALFAESRVGVGKGSQNIVMLTLGTGVGGGIMIDGKLLQGQMGRAGHLGHISITNQIDLSIVNTPGSLENAIGDYTLLNRSYGRFESTKELVKAHLNGDTFATWVWLNSVQSLARALVSLINAISPELIILSGGITKAGDALLKPLRNFMEVYEWQIAGFQTPVKLASLGASTGAVGAALFALEKTKNHHLEK